MSTQKPVVHKRGRGRPPKVREEVPTQEPEHKIVNPRFAMPVSDKMVDENLNTLTNMEEYGDLDKIIQEIHDSEMATAMDDSFATYISNTDINMDGATSLIQSDVTVSNMENIFQQIREQEEQDLAIARQLAEADNPQPTFAPGDVSVDDIEDVLEQIRQMEADEQMTKTGNAYSKPLTIDRLLAQQDKEDEDIRRNIDKNIFKSLEMQEWHSERERQDKEYKESLAHDQEKERIRAELQMKQQKMLMDAEMDAEIEVDENPIPKTREELRIIRMRFFNKTLNP